MINLTAVEAEYDGPRLDGETNVSLSFAHQLIETYKKQQKLHRRYAYKVNYVHSSFCMHLQMRV